MVDVKLTKYLIILIVSAFAIGLDFFFWIAVFVLWRNVSEESETQTEVFGKFVKRTSNVSDSCLLVRSKEESASRPPPPRYADLQTEVRPSCADTLVLTVCISRIRLRSMRLP